MKIITSTGCGEGMIVQLKEAASRLESCEYNPTLNVDTTHVVVNPDAEVSEKYKYAIAARLQIIRPEWLVESAAAGYWLNEDDYCPPPIWGRGLIVALTGFQDIEIRAGVERSVTSAGGKFSPQLQPDVTHLVAFSPEGAKYERAREWNIRIVTLGWVRECEHTGIYQPPEHFALPSEEERGWSSTEISRLPNSAVLDGCCVCLVGFKDEIMRSNEHANGSGRTNAMLTRAAALLRKGMGTRSHALSSTGRVPHRDNTLWGVTHIVVGQSRRQQCTKDEILPPNFIPFDVMDSKTRKILSKKKNHVRVVDKEWLRRCVEDEKIQETAAFEISLEVMLEERPKIVEEVAEASESKPTQSVSKSIAKTGSDRSGEGGREEHRHSGNDDQTAKKLHIPSSSMRSVSPLLRTKPVFENRTFIVDEDQEFSEMTDNLTRYGGVVYFVNSIPEGFATRVQCNTKSSRSGRRLPTCYAITRDGPNIEAFYNLLPKNVEIKRASWFWVQCVIAEQTFCKPSMKESLFTPQLEPIKKFVVTDRQFVVSVSGYDGAERSAIKQLVIAMNGQFEGNLIRDRVTHLVCKWPKGEKYKKSREWGSIKVVTAQWLYDCAREGYSAGCENNFLTDRPMTGMHSESSVLPPASDANHATSKYLDDKNPGASLASPCQQTANLECKADGILWGSKEDAPRDFDCDIDFEDEDDSVDMAAFRRKRPNPLNSQPRKKGRLVSVERTRFKKQSAASLHRQPEFHRSTNADEDGNSEEFCESQVVTWDEARPQPWSQS